MLAMKKIFMDSILMLFIAMTALALSGGMVFAAHTTPGNAGMTKYNIYDNTDDIWNVTVGTPDPVIGFVNFRPTLAGDPDQVHVVVALKDAAPNCDFTVELVTSGTNTGAGLAPNGIHTGFINNIGTISTNGAGKGNTGNITVDVTTLFGVAPSGRTTYAHVDLEPIGQCREDDGTFVVTNEYGASGKRPNQAFDLPVNMHWLQP